MTGDDVWPNLFIVGAARAGTTSLWRYLDEHPEVHMSSEKEPNFFLGDEEVKPGPDPNRFSKERYLELFEDAGDTMYRGEASVSYLWSEVAPDRIAKRCPDAKIIISLRDPISRAYSHYLKDIRDDKEATPGDFYVAIQEDLARNKDHWGYPSDYVEPGLYADQVARVLQTFGEEQVQILMFDALRQDDRGVMGDIAQFLGVDESAFDDRVLDRRYNAYGASGPIRKFLRTNHVIRWVARRAMPPGLRRYLKEELLVSQRKKPPLDPKAREVLTEIYAPDLDQLEDLIGKRPELRKNLAVKESNS